MTWLFVVSEPFCADWGDQLPYRARISTSSTDDNVGSFLKSAHYAPASNVRIGKDYFGIFLPPTLEITSRSSQRLDVKVFQLCQ